MKKVEIATGLLMLALSAVAIFALRELPYWSGFAPGPAFVPMWVASVGALLSLALLVAAVRGEARPADWPDRAGFLRVVAIVAALSLLVMSAPWLGFMPASVLAALFVLIVVLRRRWLPSLLTTVLVAATVTGIFQIWLGVPLPKGFLGV